MSADREQVRALVAEQHQHLDTWLATLEGCLDEAESPGGAAADPRLEAADDALADIDVRRQFAAAEVLGLTELAVDLVEDADNGTRLLADDFFVHLVVGLPEDSDNDSLDAILPLIDNSASTLVDRLSNAGFVVPEWEVSRGELLLDDEDEEDE